MLDKLKEILAKFGTEKDKSKIQKSFEKIFAGPKNAIRGKFNEHLFGEGGCTDHEEPWMLPGMVEDEKMEAFNKQKHTIFQYKNGENITLRKQLLEEYLPCVPIVNSYYKTFIFNRNYRVIISSATDLI